MTDSHEEEDVTGDEEVSGLNKRNGVNFVRNAEDAVEKILQLSSPISPLFLENVTNFIPITI